MSPLCIRQQFHRLAKSRLALSTVVTSLIIVVISVLLAGVVTYFAINVTSTRVQEESLALAKQHVWFDYSTGKAQAAIMVINAGGRDVVVDKLTVRGQACAWSKVFYTTTSDSISGDLFANSTLLDGGTISVGGQNRVFKQASSDITLQSGKTLIIYLDNPDSISVNDVGLTVSVNIFTSQAMYYKETNVQGTSGTTTPAQVVTPDAEIVYASAYNMWGQRADIIMVIRNNGGTAQTFDILDALGAGDLCTTDSSSHLYTCDGVTTVTGVLPDTAPLLGEVIMQTYTLTEKSGTVTLDAGDTAIVFFMGVQSTVIQGLNVGDAVTVGIHFDSGLEATKSTTTGTPFMG
jgi:hypothetical protein